MGAANVLVMATGEEAGVAGKQNADADEDETVAPGKTQRPRLQNGNKTETRLKDRK